MKNSLEIEIEEVLEMMTINKLKDVFAMMKNDGKSFKDFYDKQINILGKEKKEEMGEIYAQLGTRILFTYCGMYLKEDLLSSQDLKEISLALTNIAKEILEEAKKKEK